MEMPQKSPNPWTKLERSEEKYGTSSGSSFRDLMSEDMAKNLQKLEEEKILLSMNPKPAGSAFLDLGNVADTSNDFMVAMLLQQDFNKEHDEQIQREEKHFNKNSKLSVSFRNYKFNPDDEDEEYENFDELQQSLEDENRAIDVFEESRRTNPVIPACGYTRHNNVMVTKHDKILSGRKNAERVMSFPPGINTGDAGGFDMQISNNVYNKLARSAMSETKRKQRIQDKGDKAITEKALDSNTRLIIYKMVNNSTLESMNEIISTGKESVVIHAGGGVYCEEQLPSECALKVFKTTLTDFKTREKYIREDYRFKDRMSKNNNKTMIRLWAEKEFHNLRRLHKAKIPSPKPLLVKKHVLLMSFLGNDHVPAPKLKHIILSSDQWHNAYEQVVDIMVTMYHACKLIHGDMSEYNILWHQNKCWVIDVGQSVEPCHPHALKILYRDCCNVINFFKSKGVAKLPSPLKLFQIVSNISLPECKENEAEILIEQYEVNQELWREGKKGVSDQFDFIWNEIESKEVRAMRERELQNIDESIQDLEIRTAEDCEDTGNKSDSKSKKKNRKRNKKKKSESDPQAAATTTTEVDLTPNLAETPGEESDRHYPEDVVGAETDRTGAVINVLNDSSSEHHVTIVTGK